MPGIVKAVADEPSIDIIFKSKKNANKVEQELESDEEKRQRKAMKLAKKAEKLKEQQQDCESDDEENRERLAAKSAKQAKNLERKRMMAEQDENSAKNIQDDEVKPKKRKETACSDLDVVTEPKKQKIKDENILAPVPEVLTASAYRKLHDIRVVGTCPDPFQTFEGAGFNKELLVAVKAAGFAAPSAIQSQCWPLAMAGADVIAIAKTGSGKTAGYLFPAFMLVRKSFPLTCKRGDGPVAVVLAPTRELAIQIEQECTKLGKSSGIVSACVYGGVPKGPQIKSAMFGMHVLIATPGRMNDFLKMTNPPVLPMNRVRYVVLDEADRMLDMGFEPQIKSIFDQFPKDAPHQSIMFTATWPKEVKSLAARYLKNYVQVNIGNSGEQLTANKDVEQILYKVKQNEKDDKLVELLKAIPDQKNCSVIVFANQKHRCDYIVEGLKGIDWPAVSIHGDKDQWERQRALDRFAKGQVRVIVATDVAARGLDIKGVSHVINYDFPLNGTEDWVHRVGRTGRAGAKGTAVTLFDESCDKRSAKELCNVLRGASQVIPVWLTEMAARSGGGGGGRRPWGGGGGGGRGRGGGGGRGGGRGGNGGGGWNRRGGGGSGRR